VHAAAAGATDVEAAATDTDLPSILQATDTILF